MLFLIDISAARNPYIG